MARLLRRGHRVLPTSVASLLLALAAVTVGGCSVGGGAETSLDVPAPVSTHSPVSTAERSLLYDAEQTLIRRCMSRHGFTVRKVPEHPLPEHRDFPYVVDDVAWAREHGYGSDLERRARALRDTDPNRRYAESLGAERRAAAMDALHGRKRNALTVTLPSGAEVGRSDEGCTAEAETELYGDLAAWFRAEAVTQAVSGLRRSQVTADPAYTGAVRAWSACMHGRGLPHPDPAAARARFLDTPGKGTPTEERRTAVAEAECALSSGLSDTVGRLTSRYGDALKAEHHSVFRERDRLRRAALPRARAIAGTD
ncbi:hypothetical protein ABT063_40635 [Streptomyces sp. NPDC002838]|uniref:hypothetical protein n=1 Tax=Streptomyces sp. NPDC002838 TaxID=3154436 RepID=UPI003328EE8A